MKMKKSQLAIIISFLLFVFVTFAYSTKSSENLTLEDVLKGIQSSQSEIASGKWAVVYKRNEALYQVDEAWVLGFKLTNYPAELDNSCLKYHMIREDSKDNINFQEKC